MEFEIRIPDKSELDTLCAIERKTMPNHTYLRETADEFFDPERGEMVAAYENGSAVGIAHVSLQYDGAAWLEVLRVDPDHQGCGCGKAIWRRFLEICEKHRVPAVRMYTGLKNVVSKGLAERNGLRVAAETIEGTLSAENAPGTEDAGYAPAGDCAKALSLMQEHAAGYGGYMCFNRTFYELGEPLLNGMMKEGCVYVKEDGIAIIGARFMKNEALHIGFIGGDAEGAIRFAISLMKKKGLPKLVMMIPADRIDLRETAEKYGFTFGENHIIMLERRFDR